jgi:peptidoglycan/LPS O-acetylase OafA/YrhL
MNLSKPKEPPFTAGFSSLLDGMRWIAAAIVALSHIRGMCWVGTGSLHPANYAIKAVYAATSMGVEAVAVFFVLSGFLVGGGNYARFLHGRFDVRRYGIDRLTRIYAVLLPVLVVVALLDIIGLNWSVTAPSYTGGNQLILERYGVFKAPDLLSFLSNLVALQDFWTPVFGSNVPLWSLSYEMWFYVLAGALLFAGSAARHLRIAVALGAVALVLLLGVKFIFFLALWLIGVAAHRVSQSAFRGIAAARWAAVALLPLTMLASAQLHVVVELGGEKLNPLLLLTAAACALILITWRHTDAAMLRRAGRVNKWAASFSFTLYLAHFPVALFVSAALTAVFARASTDFSGFQPLSADGALTFLGSVGCSVLVSLAIASVTEWRTDALRARLSG